MGKRGKGDMADKFTDEQLEHMAVCTSQYDSTCRALAAELIRMRKRVKDMNTSASLEAREAARDARGAAEEAYWRGRQGEDYGSF
jgi:hypothetical protein